MPSELPPLDPRSVWQCQSVEPTAVSLDEIRKRARKYQGKVRFRNGREYAAIAFVTLFLGHTMGTLHHLAMQVGAGMCIAGSWYVAWQIHRRGRARPVPAGSTCLGFHRGELERQRDLMLGIWSWYLGPLLPGLAVVTIGAGLANPGRLVRPWLFVGGYAALVAVVFLMVARYNKSCARRLQAQIDELDSMEKQP